MLFKIKNQTPFSKQKCLFLEQNKIENYENIKINKPVFIYQFNVS